MNSLWRYLVVIPAGLLMLTVAMSAELSAQSALQDCAAYCGPCAEGGKQGYSFEEAGPYDMYCLVTDGGCLECSVTVETAGNAGGEWPEDILSALDEGNEEALIYAVGFHQDAVLLDPDEQVLALLGTPCDPEDISSVVFLTKGETDGLVAMGLSSLSNHLDSLRTTVTQ